MKALIQRVKNAAVKVANEEIAAISEGLLVFLCVMKDDTDGDLEKMVKKCSELRIFSDDTGKMNLSLQETQGELLVVSQFTLAADGKKGRRPSFDLAADPELAKKYLTQFIQQTKALGFNVSQGRFGENMQVSLINDGPVTIMLDSR